MIDALSFIGEPLQFSDKIFIYPPKIRDILVNKSLLQTYKILTQSQEDVIDILQQKDKNIMNFPTPFEFLLINCYNSKNFEELITDGLKIILRADIYFLYEYKSILIGKNEDLLKITDLTQVNLLTNDNFFSFQNSLRLVFGDKPLKEYIKEDPIVEQIKAKSRLRERRAQKNKKKNSDSFIDSISAICLMGCGVTPFNVGDLPYSALNFLIKKYQAKEKYDKDMLIISGGGDPKKIKPKYWLAPLEDEANAEDVLKNFN